MDTGALFFKARDGRARNLAEADRNLNRTKGQSRETRKAQPTR